MTSRTPAWKYFGPAGISKAFGIKDVYILKVRYFLFMSDSFLDSNSSSELVNLDKDLIVVEIY